jgi:ATP-dependent Clp protease ATP-binding subunit ClpB
MTTNIGSQVIQERFAGINEANVDYILEETKNDVFELLKQTVRPEFLNRIDETIMFRPLSEADLKKIVNIQFRIIQERLNENGIKIEASEEVLEYLGRKGFDPQFGARPLKRVLQREILNRLSKEILAGKVSKEAVVGITMGEGNAIEFINLDEINFD